MLTLLMWNYVAQQWESVGPLGGAQALLPKLQ